MLDLLNLEKFLIENSNISKKFIIDFFGFQKKTLYNKYEPYTVDLEDIAYWLETKKADIKELMTKYYSENIDFLIIKNVLWRAPEQKKGSGGHNRELVLLTSDCFKMLCMRSRTKKADRVREYYLELEKLIDKYKDLIIEEKDRKIKLLEHDLRKDDYPKGDHAYIIKETDELGETFFRIGQSGDLNSRIANHNSSSIHKKLVSFKVKTDDKLHLESCLRSSMLNFRYKNNKDYYKIPPNKVDKAIKICKNVVKTFKNNDISSSVNHTDDIEQQLTGGKKLNDFIIDIKKSNSDIKITFNKICECVMQHLKAKALRHRAVIITLLGNVIIMAWLLYESPTNAYYNGKKITAKKLNSIIIPASYSKNILIVPMQRFEKCTECINLPSDDITLKQLFNILFEYYNKKELTVEELKQIPNDIDNYAKDAIKKIKTEKVYRIDIVGSLCRYEGVHKLDDGVYRLVLGS